MDEVQLRFFDDFLQAADVMVSEGRCVASIRHIAPHGVKVIGFSETLPSFLVQGKRKQFAMSIVTFAVQGYEERDAPVITPRTEPDEWNGLEWGTDYPHRFRYTFNGETLRVIHDPEVDLKAVLPESVWTLFGEPVRDGDVLVFSKR